MRMRTTLSAAVAMLILLAVSLAGQSTSLTALDFYQLHDLNARYNQALDRGDGAAFAALFAADAILVEENGRTVSGRDALIAYASTAADKGVTNARHFYVNLAVDAAPGGARAHSHAMVAVSQQGRPLRMTTSGQFWDEYTKRDGAWQIRRRTFHKATAPWPGTMPLATTFPSLAPAPATPRPGALSAQDYADIHQIYARSAVAYDKVLDEGRTWAQLFTPDGVFVDVDGAAVRGRDQLRQALWVKGVKPVTTFLTNVVLDASSTGVVGRAYLMRRTIPPLPESPYEEPAGVVFDRIVKLPEGWRIESRTVVRINAPLPAQVSRLLETGR